MMASSTVSDYFRNVRAEIEPLLPSEPKQILEVGCGMAGTLDWLKQRWPDARTVGVDGLEAARSEIAARADVAIIHDLNQPLPDLGKFDLILALDVLEHLRDSDAALGGLTSMLAPGGVIIVSVPNIAHHSALLPLLMRRQFRYTDQGILDRTHIRFFTEESILQLVSKAGLTPTAGIITGFTPKSRLLDRVTFGALRHNLAWQYIVRAERATPQVFKWQMAG
jgi:trans-aconitate methyltransferase